MYGLLANDLEKMREVFERYPQVNRVILYGSRAKGNFKPGSDIDMTLEAKMDSQTYGQLLTDLDDLLLPYQIDLSLYHQLQNPELISHINRVGKVLYERHS
ncbi:nucleotidyltransferase domain-containing protein [Orrella daihaiensis]|uniref:Nucleotidyltransferase domain-containing protein n=2 Tax=Orrella daihaiensis TaxID=2782176 RepID=A0ABY4ATX2_9BURK|nr:nucleotidyltransferase domain-containing protein [Orrella daihaiensis]